MWKRLTIMVNYRGSTDYLVNFNEFIHHCYDISLLIYFSPTIYLTESLNINQTQLFHRSLLYHSYSIFERHTIFNLKNKIFSRIESIHLFMKTWKNISQVWPTHVRIMLFGIVILYDQRDVLMYLSWFRISQWRRN